jgi:hypothetical protein
MRVVAHCFLASIGVVHFGTRRSCWVGVTDHVVDFIHTRKVTSMRAVELLFRNQERVRCARKDGIRLGRRLTSSIGIRNSRTSFISEFLRQLAPARDRLDVRGIGAGQRAMQPKLLAVAVQPAP